MKKSQRLDSAAIGRMLKQERVGPESAVLRLAWLEGLTREEIAALTWDHVSFLDARLELPDRMVPLDPDLQPFLWKLWEAHRDDSPYVVLSSREHTPLRPESISRLARKALDRAGMQGVRLLDLRYDWILRQLERLDWPETARISGMAVASLQAHFAPAVPPAAESRQRESGQVDEFKLWKLLQAEQDTPAGLALWLAWQLGLQGQEIIALTWDQIDFEANCVHLSDRDASLTSALRRMLEGIQNARRPGDDPHVLLTEQSRRPLDLPRLSRMTRAVLIRGGLERVALRDLRKDDGRTAEDNAILELVRDRGSVSRSDVVDLLRLSKSAVYGRLRRLTGQERLVRIGGKYYLPGTVVPPEQHQEAIQAYISEAGFAYRQDIVDLLHIQPKQCSLVLRHLVDAGALLQEGQKYYLASGGGS